MRRTTVIGGFLILSSALWAQARYDLLLKGGHVIDPKNQINQTMDVAIAEGKIARVAQNIPPEEAKKVIDVAGLFVTPGLVDMHVHLYSRTRVRGARPFSYDGTKDSSGDRGVYPDGFTFRNGVTTVVDTGSSGWRNFPDFKDRVIDRSKTRVFVMLNIIGLGLGGRITDIGKEEDNDTKDMDPQATAKRAREYPDVIVGVKTAHFAGPEWIAVDRAVEAGKLANLPVMVDFGTFRPERPFEELVTRHLRPGDIYTHMYTEGVPMFDDHGKVRSYLFEARKRGVKFDVGHGGGGFLWKQAIPAIQQGWIPDSISTDLHLGSMNAGMKDMLNMMSKILNQGIPLAEVIKMSTINPALEIKRPQFGHLTVGAVADVAVIRMDQGQFGFLDSRRARFMGTKLLVCELTLRGGAVEWDLNGRAGEDWKVFYKLKN